jgi:hypothetical protein
MRVQIVTPPSIQKLFDDRGLFGPQRVFSRQFLDARAEPVFVDDPFQVPDISERCPLSYNVAHALAPSMGGEGSGELHDHLVPGELLISSPSDLHAAVFREIAPAVKKICQPRVRAEFARLGRLPDSRERHAAKHLGIGRGR